MDRRGKKKLYRKGFHAEIGQKGGKLNAEKHGKEHMKKIAMMGVAARKKKRENAIAV